MMQQNNLSSQSLRQAKVLVVGDAMLDDYWFGDVHRISPEAPIPILAVERSEHRLGGAANVASNIISLGGDAQLIATCGEDDNGLKLKALLEKQHIKAHLFRDKQLHSTYKLRLIARHQQLIRTDFDGHTSLALSRQITLALKEHLSSIPVIVFSDYGKGVLGDVAQMIQLAQQAKVLCIVDPKGHDFERYRGANVLTPNRAEFSAVAGTWNNEDELTQKAWQMIDEYALDSLLLTRSEDGMTLYQKISATQKNRNHISAHAQQVFDVSGAGDTVNAVLACAIASGASLLDAAKLANRAAGIVVSKVGTATLTPEELFATH